MFSSRWTQIAQAARQLFNPLCAGTIAHRRGLATLGIAAAAEAERLERIGRVASAQMARDGELLHRHPLLIQKTMADKLSDKIQVIIAPPSVSGGFFAASLLGGAMAGAPGRDAATAQAKAEDE
jgi:hypothetical protein